MVIQPQGDILLHQRIRATLYQEVTLFHLRIRSGRLDRSDVLLKLSIQGCTLERVQLLRIGRKRQADKSQ